MEIKKILILSFAILTTLGTNAQSRLSSTITDMLASVQQQIAEAQSAPRAMSVTTDASPVCYVDTAAIQRRMVTSFNADGSVRTVDVVAELANGASCPTAALSAKGITVNGEALGFVFLTVPADQLEFLETLPEFISLEADNINQPDNDNSRTVLNVSNINGIDNKSVLSSAYTGKGVVVGIIDAGIDYNHIAFKDSEGNTRIKKAVNYTSSTSGYTIATTPEAIANLTWDYMVYSEKADLSHGTHVACSAAGSQVNALVDYSLGSRNLMGMAPEADLVLCGTNNYSDSRVTFCMNEIIKTADELGEPCVINMSFGNTGGWHNGTTISKAIDKVAKAGVVVCMSTANEGIYKRTVEKTVAANDYITVIPTKTGSVSSADKIYIPAQTITFYMPQCTGKSSETVSYSFEVVDSLSGNVTTLAETPLKSASTNESITPSFTFSNDASTKWLKGTLSLSRSYFDDNSKFLVVKIKNITGNPLRIYAISNVVADRLASTDFPSYTYDKGTADMSINNSCCTENLISVGSYTRSRAFKSYNIKEGKQYTFSVKDVGNNNSTSAFSSYGRDDYGKMHPDVVAPGTAIISAYNYYDTTHADAASQTIKSGNDGAVIAAYNIDSANKMNLWKVSNGTSMATPITAGIIALWMQAQRENAPEEADLSVADVRDIIQQTSRAAVNNVPIAISAGSTEQNRLQLGNGLIDAEAGLKYLLHILSLEPIKEETTTTFASNDFDKDIDIVNNVYHSISNGYYDSTENCVVLNQPTTSFDESVLNDITDVNSETDIEGFNGFIQAVSGKGSIKINAQTFGTTNLAVKIGNDNAKINKLPEKGNITFNYDVNDAYIFIYPTSSNESNSMDLATTDNTTDNAVKIHSITVRPEVTALAHVNSANNNRNNNIVKKFVSNKIIIVKNGKLYNTAGQRVE